jgi:mono/diheme cytochrome c family protein
MNSKTLKSFLLGAISAYALVAAVLVSAVGLGILPVQADVAPSRLEAAVLGTALHAVVAHRAPAGVNPVVPSEENLIQGARLYTQMCARCHGLSKESDNTLGQSFYPPAPHLPLRRTTYSQAEVFWLVKHGIRNTAMPAWGNLLVDEDIWRVAMLVGNFGSLPDSVTAELRSRHH